MMSRCSQCDDRGILPHSPLPCPGCFIAGPKTLEESFVPIMEPIDTSNWWGLTDLFGSLPTATSDVYKCVWNKQDFACRPVVLCVRSSDKVFAIKTLRRDLQRLRFSLRESVSIQAFMGKPIAFCLANGQWQVSCVFFGLSILPSVEPLTSKTLRQLGCALAIDNDTMPPVVDPRTDDVQPEPEDTSADNGETDEFYTAQPPVGSNEVVVTSPGGRNEVVVTGVLDPVEAIAHHPEMKQAFEAYNVDLRKPGAELQEMRKYFGQGSGLYLVNVDFRLARSEAFLLNEKAKKKIAKALKPAVKKKSKPKASKPAAKVQKKVKKPALKTKKR